MQSSTMAIMAACGEFPSVPNVAIFADTQDEPKAVYDWLDWLKTKLPFPIIRVSKGKLSEAALRVRTSKETGLHYTKPQLPVFTKYKSEGTDLLDEPIERPGGKMPRHCTADFKIELLKREAKRLAGLQPISMWIGISTDEIIRMKPSNDARIEHRFPLIDDVPMSRTDCLHWMRGKGYPEPPRSACIYCPYHSDEEWLRIKTETPLDFKFAVEFEKKLQHTFSQLERIDSVPYLHDSRKPLSEVVFDRKKSSGFIRQAPCEGMCGV